MSRPIIKIHNAETGEIIEREMNDSELAQFEKDKESNTKQEEKAQAKATLLDKLGITEDEAKLLLS